MAKPDAYRLVLCTCPDVGSAEAIAKALVEAGLGAAVNIVPGLHSMFAWEGRVRTARECLILVKTHVDRYAALEAAIRERHPYELPSILSVRIDAGLAPYLDWIGQSIS